MDAEDRGAALVRGDRGTERRGERAGARFGSKRRPSELLRESPTSTGRPSATRTSSRRTSSKFCAAVLPKPIPGSRQIRSSGIPAATANASRSSRNAATSDDDVVVARVGLHRARLALHVHQAEVRTALGNDAGELGVAPQRRDVVDELGAEFERAAGYLALRRVDRDGNAVEPLENRHDAAELLVDRDPCGAGPRRLAAHVDDRGACPRPCGEPPQPRRPGRSARRRPKSCPGSRSRSPSRPGAANVPPPMDVSPCDGA